MGKVVRNHLRTPTLTKSFKKAFIIALFRQPISLVNKTIRIKNAIYIYILLGVCQTESRLVV